MGNDGEGSGEDLTGGAVIFFQTDGVKLRKILPQPVKAGRVRAPEAIDGLVRISDHKKLRPIPVPGLHQAVLQRVDVLKLIDQKAGKARKLLCVFRIFCTFRIFCAFLSFLRLFLQNTERLQKQVVIVHDPLLLHGLLIQRAGFPAPVRFRFLPFFPLRLCHPVFHPGELP